MLRLSTILRVSLLLTTGVALTEACAAPVSEAMAAKAVGNWRVRKGQLGMRLGTNVSCVRRVRHQGAAFHVVRFDGGGYAVTPADTTVRPVILFSEGDDFAVDDENPALALLVGELSARPTPETAQTAQTPQTSCEAAWAELLEDCPPLEMGGKAAIDDVRVEPIIKTNWAQDYVGGKPCFNYYTPSNSVCGCVATSGSQILRTLRFPNKPIEPFKKACRYNGDRLWLTSQGGTYDWDNMPETPTSSTPDAQRRAIGKLTSDVGIGVGMAYSTNSSASTTLMLQYAFKTFFGLAHVSCGFSPDGTTAAGDNAFGEVLRANFDAKLPVAIGIKGHSIAGDGYGYLGKTLYYHLNMGWGKASNVWYAPPDDFGSWRGFEYACHNIYTNAAMNALVIASGRITDEYGEAAEGVKVWAEDSKGARAGEPAISDAHGIYALFVEPGQYRIRASRVETEGAAVGEFYGEAAAKPGKCSTCEAQSNGDYTYVGTWAIQGNDAGCDVALEWIDYGMIGSVAVSGGITWGADFASLTIPVSARVSRFGGYVESATVTVTLYENGVARATRTHDIADTAPHAFTVAFDGLTAGANYAYDAVLEAHGIALAATDAELAVAAREVTITAPPEAVLAADEVVADVVVGGTASGAMATPLVVAQGKGAVWCDGETRVLSVWDGSAWQLTDVTVEAAATNRISILRRAGAAPVYRIFRNGAWKVLGAAPALPAQLTRVGATGVADVVSLAGVAYDPNRLACPEGGVEYADLSAAIAAGETRTLAPLWATKGVVPDAALTVLSVFDPGGLLSMTGSTLIKKTAGAGGVTTYCYGTMSREEVDSSDYLKATSALGLSHAIQETSEVRMEDVAAQGGGLTFKVKVDDEQVMRERVKDYVRVADGLGAEWREPGEGEIAVGGGAVTVTPATGKGRAFVRVELPKD